jgi:hypothetical protein
LAGSVGERSRARFGRLGARGGASFGDAPAQSAVRGPDRGGGTVRQPGSAYKGLFLVCLKVSRLLFICSLFNCSGEQSLRSSDVELQPMDIVDDIKTHVEVCLVYWNK